MEGVREFISRQHVRVASSELPWVPWRAGFNSEGVAPLSTNDTLPQSSRGNRSGVAACQEAAQPLRGWTDDTNFSQGSSPNRNPGLEDVIPSGLRRPRALTCGRAAASVAENACKVQPESPEYGARSKRFATQQTREHDAAPALSFKRSLRSLTKLAPNC